MDDTDVLKVLIENKANVNLKKKHHVWTALHITAWNDQAAVAQMLLVNGSKVDDTKGMGRNPLMIAAQQENTNISEVLIENKSNLHLKQQNGWTALHTQA